MGDVEEKAKGYVYVLEVKDITLPVCKIGMTTRSPYERCDEINNSSTGDFIWEVAYHVHVDNCRKLESLVHSKLTPLRQKNREFFNISGSDAFAAIISILNAQAEIKVIAAEEILPKQEEMVRLRKRPKGRQYFRKVDSEYAELLQSFNSVLGIKGRPFGQLNKPVFGISDGNKGVQWNIEVSADTGIIRLGVNLEGMTYRNWPISTFIQSEMKHRQLGEVATQLPNPDDVFVRFSRDAWQGRSRPDVVERFIGGREYSLSECDSDRWLVILNEALRCLDEGRRYRGRSKQEVTLTRRPKSGAQARVYEVSPHLTIWTPLSMNGSKEANIRNKIIELMPVYDWVKRASQS